MDLFCQIPVRSNVSTPSTNYDLEVEAKRIFSGAMHEQQQHYCSLPEFRHSMYSCVENVAGAWSKGVREYPWRIADLPR